MCSFMAAGQQCQHSRKRSGLAPLRQQRRRAAAYFSRIALVRPPFREADRDTARGDPPPRLPLLRARRPEIADEAYDALFRELVALEEQHPELRRPRLADPAGGRRSRSTAFPTVEHAAPMLSLESDQSEAALRRFDERLRKALGRRPRSPTSLEPKLDGASLELVYEDGVLARAATRGDGCAARGSPPTSRTIASVPLRLRGARAGAAVPRRARRGDHAHRATSRRSTSGCSPRARSRSPTRATPPPAPCASSTRASPPSRPLDLYAYDVLAAERRAPGCRSQREVLEALRDWGLRVNDARGSGAERSRTSSPTTASSRRAATSWATRSTASSSSSTTSAPREDLGRTARHPRWAFAFKFPPRKEVTRVRSIVPASAAPGWSRRSRCCCRSSSAASPSPRATPAQPRGGGAQGHARGRPGARAAGGRRHPAGHRADRRERSATAERRLAHARSLPLLRHAARRARPVHRLPERLRLPGAARRPARPLRLARRAGHRGPGRRDAPSSSSERAGAPAARPLRSPPEQLVELEGFAEKSANKLVEAIASRPRRAASRFLYGLGIPEVGVAGGARPRPALRRLLGAARRDAEELQEVSGVGPRMAEQITAFFAEPENAELLDQLVAAPRAHRPAAPEAGGALAGKKFVFTGGLAARRREAKELVEPGRQGRELGQQGDRLRRGRRGRRLQARRRQEAGRRGARRGRGSRAAESGGRGPSDWTSEVNGQPRPGLGRAHRMADLSRSRRPIRSGCAPTATLRARSPNKAPATSQDGRREPRP